MGVVILYGYYTNYCSGANPFAWYYLLIIVYLVVVTPKEGAYTMLLASL